MTAPSYSSTHFVSGLRDVKDTVSSRTDDSYLTKILQAKFTAKRLEEHPFDTPSQMARRASPRPTSPRARWCCSCAGAPDAAARRPAGGGSEGNGGSARPAAAHCCSRRLDSDRAAKHKYRHNRSLHGDSYNGIKESGVMLKQHSIDSITHSNSTDDSSVLISTNIGTIGPYMVIPTME